MPGVALEPWYTLIRGLTIQALMKIQMASIVWAVIQKVTEANIRIV